MKLPKFLLSCATAACLGAFSTTPAHAAAITINNYSFENLPAGYWAEANPISSWTGTGNNLTAGGSWDASTRSVGSITGGSGSYMLDIHVDTGATGTVTGSGWINTASLGTYTADTVYTLTVAIATPNTWATPLNSIIALGTNGTPGSALALITTPVGSLSDTAFTNITVTLDTSVVTSAVGQNIVVLLEHNATIGASYGRDIYFDNVRLDTLAVPEPATWALLAFSLTSVVVFRRRNS